MRLSYKIAVPIMYLSLLCVTCDPALYPYRGQTMHSENRYTPLAYRNYFPRDMYPTPSIEHRMYHSREPPFYHIEEPRDSENLSSSFSNFLNAVNELDDHREKPQARAQEFPSYFPDLRLSNKLKHGNNIKSEYNEEAAPAHDYETPTTIAPPADNKGISVSFLKPDWSSITKPVANMNMDKWSGLLQLILAFITGSKSGNLEFKGFKDIIINGLVKPILEAKGNVKSFISKITIPLLSLLLINVEILVTVWWLWEDCPKEMKLESSDPKTPNNYTYT